MTLTTALTLLALLLMVGGLVALWYDHRRKHQQLVDEASRRLALLEDWPPLRKPLKPGMVVEPDSEGRPVIAEPRAPPQSPPTPTPARVIRDAHNVPVRLEVPTMPVETLELAMEGPSKTVLVTAKSAGGRAVHVGWQLSPLGCVAIVSTPQSDGVVGLLLTPAMPGAATLTISAEPLSREVRVTVREPPAATLELALAEG